MISINKKILNFNLKEVHFSDYPYDIDKCDFLNFRYCKNKVNFEGFDCKKEYTIIIDLTQDLDIIWNNMDKKSARNRINGAQKDGLVIHKNKDYDEFFQTYRSFIQKKHIKSLFDIFGVGSTTLESMKKNGTLFVAKYGDELLNGTLYLEDDSHIEAWISATKRFDITSNKKKLFGGSDRLVDWEAIKYAKEKGLKEFDLGGIWPEEEAAKDIIKQGINDFKKNYGGKVVTRYSYQKYYSKTFKLISNLYSLRYLGR